MSTLPLSPVSEAPAADTRISHAFVRTPGAALLSCSARIDSERIAYQHQSFCRALTACRVTVRAVRQDQRLPDSLTLRDIAVVAGDVAILSRFSPQSLRHGEETVATNLLASSRTIVTLPENARLDASDVTRLGDCFFISLSSRTDAAGAGALADLLQEQGYTALIIDLFSDSIERLGSCLCDLGDGRILIREDLARHFAFFPYEKIIVPADETPAAGAERVNGTLLLPARCRKTAARLETANIPFISIDMSEFEKAGLSLNRLALTLPARGQEHIVDLSHWRENAAA